MNAVTCTATATPTESLFIAFRPVTYPHRHHAPALNDRSRRRRPAYARCHAHAAFTERPLCLIRDAAAAGWSPPRSSARSALYICAVSGKRGALVGARSAACCPPTVCRASVEHAPQVYRPVPPAKGKAQKRKCRQRGKCYHVAKSVLHVFSRRRREWRQKHAKRERHIWRKGRGVQRRRCAQQHMRSPGVKASRGMRR